MTQEEMIECAVKAFERAKDLNFTGDEFRNLLQAFITLTLDERS